MDPTLVLKHVVLHLPHIASSLLYHGYLLVTHLYMRFRLLGPPRLFNIDLLYMLYMLITSFPFRIVPYLLVLPDLVHFSAGPLGRNATNC